MPIGQLDGVVQTAVVDPTNPTSTPQPGSASTMDSVNQATVPLYGVGLINPGGKVDRLHEESGYPQGAALVADATGAAQNEILMGLLRTQVLLLLRIARLLGGARACSSPPPEMDDPDLQTWLNAGANALSDIIDQNYQTLDPVKLQ